MRRSENTRGRVEVYSPEERAGRQLDDDVRLPPTIPNIPIGAIVGRRVQYWGVRQAISSYRSLVQANVELSESITRLFRARRELEEERARWENIETYKDAARHEAEAVRHEAERQRNEAAVKAKQQEVELQLLKDRLTDGEQERKKAKNIRAAEVIDSERERLEAEQRLKQAQGKVSSAESDQWLEELKEMRAAYDKLMKEKEADIERYGGEDKLPHALQVFYDRMEDQLGLRGD